MKTVIEILTTILAISLIIVSCNDQPIETQNLDYVNIPDNSFKSKILDAGYDLNNDGEISYSEAKMIDTLYVAEPDPTSINPKIKDITGIEAFTNLEYFNCYGNNITGEVDFSKNINFLYLNIGVNSITKLTLSNLTKLIELDVLLNSLSFLDLSTNASLRKLSISLNDLTQIDITNNVNLEEFTFLGNFFTTIDFSKNIHLKKLGISGAHHNMTSLDISNCSEIEHLSLSYIDIPILDISQNQKIQELSLGFLDSLEKICVWELPFPDSIVVNFTGCSAPFIICE